VRIIRAYSYSVTTEMLEDFANDRGHRVGRDWPGHDGFDFKQTLRCNEVYYHLAQGIRG